MAKHKLQRFEDINQFENVFQPPAATGLNNTFSLKGKWNSEYFKNNNPIVLELGCGKGEYTIGQAEKFQNKNFIGVDIKGARLWKGAKTAIENKMVNVAFVRTRIEFISSFFDVNEVSEIWVTFPDPQPNRVKKRLTSSRFLNLYRQVLIANGPVHLKTDSLPLYLYTESLVKKNRLPIIKNTADLYNSNEADDILGIKTYYEEQFLKQNILIKYIKFILENKEISELPE